MLNLSEYLRTNAYKLERVFRSKEDAAVALLRRQDGTKFVCRLYTHPVSGYFAAAELETPALPRIYRCTVENGIYIVEEEFIDGISLADLMEVYRPDTRQSAAIAERLCQALHALHTQGIIHRDVKPENVLITSGGRVVLIDLDASSEYDPAKERDTSLLGTAGYAAPEQFGFSRSDVRTDVFSLGVMLNVMLTGKHPSHHLAEGPLRPIIERCIEVNADKRFSSAAELGKKLAALSAPEATCPHCGFVSPGGGCLCCGIPSVHTAKRKKRPLLLAALFVCALVLFFAAQWQKNAAPTVPLQQESTKPPTSELIGEISDELPTPAFLRANHLSRPFTVFADGEEHRVYMAAGMCEQTFPHSSDSNSVPFGVGEYEDKLYGIGFYQKTGENEYVRIEEASLLQAIHDAVGESLTLELLPDPSNGNLPQHFPDYSAHICTPACLKGITLRMGLEHRGCYVLRATATIGEEYYLCDFLIEWLPTEEIRFRYDPAGGGMIDQINTFLATLPYDDTRSVRIDIPAGVYEGQIHVPEELRLMGVEINGTLSAEGHASVIRGGVESHNFYTTLTDLRFEGAGMGLDGIPAQWPDGRENAAFFGPGGGSCENCSFSGYSVAVTSVDRLKAPTCSLFENNATAVCINTLSADGGSTFAQNEYRANGVALHFKRLNSNWPTTWFETAGSSFIANGVDLQNDLGRDVPLPQGYYANIVNGIQTPREGIVVTG